MDLLLLHDVPTVGKKSDLLTVKNGFALNYLLPRRLAIVATPPAPKPSPQAGAAAALAGKSIAFVKKTTKTGKLYAALSGKAISEACKEQLNIDIAADDITIPSPIKAIGTFEVRIKIGETDQPLAVTVTAETAPKK